ncbi:hypothetical protein EI94DRAFT_1700633 [Lactarius quietus]|nr:hypothetical protein EI94DRAFT_1700633 [Lactarius quietus]
MARLVKEIGIGRAREDVVEPCYPVPSPLRWPCSTFTCTPTDIERDQNILGIVGFLNHDYPSTEDLTTFVCDCRSDATAADATLTIWDMTRATPATSSEGSGLCGKESLHSPIRN